jgi:predicted P-loop ATPase
MEMIDPLNLKFLRKTRELFVFLKKLGFYEVKSSTTLVCYKKGTIEVDIYHGRQSYEIGAGVTISGMRYSISEIIRVSVPERFKQFRYAMATTPESVTKALEEISSLMQRFGKAALTGDPEFIATLTTQREQWSKEYALEVLAEQLRPKASEAFQKKDYSTAAEIYTNIRESLSPTELKKLNYAIKHSNTAK